MARPLPVASFHPGNGSGSIPWKLFGKGISLASEMRRFDAQKAGPAVGRGFSASPIRTAAARVFSQVRRAYGRRMGGGAG
jgi:hypothetical protein